MRAVLFCFLLGGCSILDGIADDAANTSRDNRVFLGHESVFVRRQADLDRYTCHRAHMICEAYGGKWQCSCDLTSFAGL